MKEKNQKKMWKIKKNLMMKIVRKESMDRLLEHDKQKRKKNWRRKGKEKTKNLRKKKRILKKEKSSSEKKKRKKTLITAKPLRKWTRNWQTQR